MADYSQLELRIMAHMTNCKTMIQAFELGGDFHSRTCVMVKIFSDEHVSRNKKRSRRGKTAFRVG